MLLVEKAGCAILILGNNFKKGVFMSYSFAESEELQLMRATVRKFAESEIAPVAGRLDEEEKFSVELRSGLILKYNKPFLVDNVDHTNVVDQTLYRAHTALDSEDLAKAPRPSVIASSFDLK